ncbi:hypothetical protein CYLTODRAFT_401701 [Cylindrobasidium torrendii FP15055 ss-10]|uniref:Zn(2)-C6 fungal-type domain-containing protein n=1 Tax=Cylindrobasidium torrendii FP15055 ss-10 TaxID=1314674 RepID=A0A0D7B300_9AGAR|nr:hypothetical protein CYLTODRAFT_401701 [Cylindrobasidium torrendii FP15055 ss-10]
MHRGTHLPQELKQWYTEARKCYRASQMAFMSLAAREAVPGILPGDSPSSHHIILRSRKLPKSDFETRAKRSCREIPLYISVSTMGTSIPEGSTGLIHLRKYGENLSVGEFKRRSCHLFRILSPFPPSQLSMEDDSATVNKTRRRARRRVGTSCFRFEGDLEREVENKRNRGEVSCAECRRLKIKCDKQVPCKSCVRRGCTSLCPNGSLSTGQGTRFVLAATEHLHRKIEFMTGRIRQLEDTLAQCQSPFAAQSVLQQPEILELELRMSESEQSSPERDSSPENYVLPDNQGTLTMGQHGVSKFFGATGGCEGLIMAAEDTFPAYASSPLSTSGLSTASSSKIHASRPSDFPFQWDPLQPASTLSYTAVIDSLPSWERASTLILSYTSLLGWFIHGVEREQVNEILGVVYGKRSGLSVEAYSPHDVALLCIVFSVGSLVEKDTTSDGQDAYDESEHYYRFAQIALSAQSWQEKPSLVTVQTLHLMSTYTGMKGGNREAGATMETSWSLSRTAANVALTIGLHRDAEAWGLPENQVQRRRLSFWELYVEDIWQSLHSGRPPVFDLSFVDCKYPSTPGISEYALWQFKFAADCVSKVAAQNLLTEPPYYETVLHLDERISQYTLPTVLAANEPVLTWQSFMLSHVRESLRMYLHRGYFTQAFVDDPANPLRTRYANSVMATCKSSSEVLKSVNAQFTACDKLSKRFWPMWASALSAGVSFGTVVTSGPTSPLAASAMAELKSACMLFSKASSVNAYSGIAATILNRLYEKAALVQDAARDHGGSEFSASGLAYTNNTDLQIFGGRRMFVQLSRPFDARPMDSPIAGASVPLYHLGSIPTLPTTTPSPTLHSSRESPLPFSLQPSQPPPDYNIFDISTQGPFDNMDVVPTDSWEAFLQASEAYPSSGTYIL